MTSTTESGSRYLSLALSARGVMTSLRPVVNGSGNVPEIGASLLSFIQDVQGDTAESYIHRLQESGTIPSYEQVSTFETVTERFGVDNVKAAFRALLDTQQAGQIEGASRLIEFFGAVEGQALDQYSSCLQARMA